VNAPRGKSRRKTDFCSNRRLDNQEGFGPNGWREAATECEGQTGCLSRSIGVGIGHTQPERIGREAEPLTD